MGFKTGHGFQSEYTMKTHENPMNYFMENSLVFHGDFMGYFHDYSWENSHENAHENAMKIP